jgi:hypothetical protein
MAIISVVLVGCSQVGEPWVSSDEQLTDERSRSVTEADGLRDRLALGQIDR